MLLGSRGTMFRERIVNGINKDAAPEHARRSLIIGAAVPKFTRTMFFSYVIVPVMELFCIFSICL